MRTWGRTRDILTGAKTWVEVSTDANGYNDMVYLTALVQTLKLNLGESPFFADWGLPATASVRTQIAPDFNAVLTQKRYAAFFLSLMLIRQPDGVDDTNRPVPQYAITVITNTGAVLSGVVPV
jgi:hypothetical protein